MEKIIHKLINEFTEGVDTYTHNNSTWLIFTETKQWVIELTENKTLWYNYNFFKSVFAYASLDCVQNQHLITKWVEDNIINKELTYVTLFRDARDRKQQFEDTLENGVKYTKMAHMKTDWSVDDTIENGVKETLKLECCEYTGDVDEVLENGVKNTDYGGPDRKIGEIKDTIQNGVKETKSDDFNVSQFLCEEVIDKGVKETSHVDVMKFFDNKMEDALKNGVKETKQKKNALLILDTSGRELILESHLVVRDGVRSSTPRQYVGENIIEKIINKGELETYDIDWDVPTDLIEDVINDGVKETYDDEYHHKGRIDGVIKNGVKETHREICEYKETIDYIIQTGVKETKTPGDDGDIVGVMNWMMENNTKNVPKMIDDIIENGVKKTMAGNYTDPSTSLLYIKWEAQIEDVIDNGNKVCGTYVGGHRQEEKTETVIEYGKQI